MKARRLGQPPAGDGIAELLAQSQFDPGEDERRAQQK